MHPQPNTLRLLVPRARRHAGASSATAEEAARPGKPETARLHGATVSLRAASWDQSAAPANPCATPATNPISALCEWCSLQEVCHYKNEYGRGSFYVLALALAMC